MDISKIGVIGLGNMGAPMARNLLKAGFSVVVNDLSVQAVRTLEAEGAIASRSLEELVGLNVDAVLTMLPTPGSVREVYCGTDGLLNRLKRETVLIDSSTIDPATARFVFESALERGHTFLDAPVSGGVGGAETGSLTFMVGGSGSGFEVSQPVLRAMGKSIRYCGHAGSGQAAKLCNNLLLAISMIGVSEAMSLGRALGLEPELLASIINSSTGRCWSSESYNPYPGIVEGAPASRRYEGGFMVDLMLKDLSLALESARKAHHPVMMGAAAQQIYQLASSQGNGSYDFSSVIRLYHRDPN